MKSPAADGTNDYSVSGTCASHGDDDVLRYIHGVNIHENDNANTATAVFDCQD